MSYEKNNIVFICIDFYSIRINEFEKTSRIHLPHFERTDFVSFVSQRVLQDLVEILIRENY